MSAPVMSRDEARAVIDRAVRLSKADEIVVSLTAGQQNNVRFADNRMTTAGTTDNLQLAVSSAFGPKHAVVTTNDTSDAALERAVRQSETLARLAPDDPEAMPALGPQQYADVRGYYESTASLSAAARAQSARIAIDAARSSGDLKAAGFLATGASARAAGNNKGMFAYVPLTSANYTLTVRTTDGTGSGWAGAAHPDWTQVDHRAVSGRAISKARLSRNPQPIDPGRYTVILEPQAVGDLVQLLGFALDARSADEGRSAFSKEGGGTKIGMQVVNERVTLFSDPADPQLAAAPVDDEGFPLKRQVWIENGLLKNLVYSRFWAKKQGKEPTGFTSTLKMAGGDTSLEEMIRTTDRGVLVTRLWYLRQVDPRTVLYTGLTRDGTFLIEGGKVSKALRNFRFNESPLLMLERLEAVGRPIRLAGTEAGGAVAMPALKIRDFHFTSSSEAV